MVGNSYVGVDDVARKLINGYVVTKDTNIKNLIQNGSLHTNTNEWVYDTSGVTITQNDGFVTCSYSGNNPFVIRQFFNPSKLSINENSNPIWYACAKIRGRTTNTGHASISIAPGVENAGDALRIIDDGVLNDGNWHTVSGVYKYKEYANDNWIPNMIRMYINGESEPYDIKEVFVANLTEIFGVNNEPDKEWCDINLTEYSDTIQLPQGVEGKSPKKIIKGYVGVNSMAKKVFGVIDTVFDSNILPSIWEIKSGKNDMAEAWNSYGRWVIEGQISNETPILNAFNSNENDYCELNRNQTFVIQQFMVYPPTGVEIKPVSVKSVYGYSTVYSVYGYNKDIGWERICNAGSTNSNKISHTHSVTTNNFYTKFRIEASSRTANHFRLYSFQILSGTIRA